MLFGITASLMPVNFYCRHQCVQQLPDSDTALPQQLMLLYRPSSKSERSTYKQLLKEGYIDEDHTYFTDGQKDSYGTMVATLIRR